MLGFIFHGGLECVVLYSVVIINKPNAYHQIARLPVFCLDVCALDVIVTHGFQTKKSQWQKNLCLNFVQCTLIENIAFLQC